MSVLEQERDYDPMQVFTYALKASESQRTQTVISLIRTSVKFHTIPTEPRHKYCFSCF